MPRQAKLDSPGTLYHVMIRGLEKRRIVDDDSDRRDFVRRLGTLAEETRTPIYTWALMTNHAHLLLFSGGSSQIHAPTASLERDMSVEGFGPVTEPDQLGSTPDKAIAIVQEGKPAVVNVVAQPR